MINYCYQQKEQVEKNQRQNQIQNKEYIADKNMPQKVKNRTCNKPGRKKSSKEDDEIYNFDYYHYEQMFSL
ncbi:MAG: hypothetical protein KAI50_01425 [Desulfobacterales bacterium]|nr:hypothetical protein [Desulfobacterales bacterium]